VHTRDASYHMRDGSGSSRGARAGEPEGGAADGLPGSPGAGGSLQQRLAQLQQGDGSAHGGRSNAAAAAAAAAAAGAEEGRTRGGTLAAALAAGTAHNPGLLLLRITEGIPLAGGDL
jgi:hypothetical protein